MKDYSGQGGNCDFYWSDVEGLSATPRIQPGPESLNSGLNSEISLQTELSVAPLLTPTDPLFGNQAHFALIGDIETIWDEYTGSGVNIGVYDDGIDYSHIDLDDNYNASLHVVDGNGEAIDPVPNIYDSPFLADDAHGTAVAGLIGAEQGNGEGVVGVAFGSSLTGINIFSSSLYGYVNAFDFSPFMDVAGQGAQFDISSNSWGASPILSDTQNLNGDGFAAQLDEVYSELSANGRDGLGTVITQAAGNDNLDAGRDGLNASRYTITVGATDLNGNIANYSNYGSSILLAAPAAEVSTDLTGSAGYEAGDYATEFGGTSAATPIVSGVAALMLEANPVLGWRDVQNILALSASHTGSGLDQPASGFEEAGWDFNGSENWNGGGAHISASYGFGMVNAYNAVRMAEVWQYFGDAQTSSNEVAILSDINDNGGNSVILPDGDLSGFDFEFDITENVQVEHVALHVNFASTYAGDVAINLISPAGTEVQVSFHDGAIAEFFFGDWTYGADHFLGEDAAGTWTVNIADALTYDENEIFSVQLEIFGSEASSDSVYHFTEEFPELVAIDASRSSVGDSDGGTDWLNFAAVSEGVFVDLGGSTGFGLAGGESWGSFEPGSEIENIVSGDGNDILTGSDLDNTLVGMRGDDTLYGGGGTDHLIVGSGNDTLTGGDGSDRFELLAGNEDRSAHITDFQADDVITFANFTDDRLNSVTSDGTSTFLQGGEGASAYNISLSGDYEQSDFVETVLGGANQISLNETVFETSQGQTRIIDLNAYFSDLSNISIEVLGAADNGTAEISTDGTSIIYTPDDDYLGSDSIYLEVNATNSEDGLSAEVYQFLNVLVDDEPNQAPTALDTSQTLLEDSVLNFDVSELIADADGDQLSLSILSGPANGEAVLDGTAITYTPDANFFGNDSLIYQVDDGRGGTAQATIDFTVTDVVDETNSGTDPAEAEAADDGGDDGGSDWLLPAILGFGLLGALYFAGLRG